MGGGFVKCKCGVRFEKLSQLKNVKQRGLTLSGVCPSCGLRLAVGELWKVKKRIIKGGEIWRAR